MKKIITAIVLLHTLSVQAQNTLRPALYFQNMNYYNAGAGIGDTAATRDLSLYARYKLLKAPDSEVWNKPVSLYLNHLHKLGEKSFLHASYLYDGYSFYKRHIFYAGYGREFTLGKAGKLSAGARAVLNFNTVDWEALGHVPDKSSKQLRFNPGLDVGAQYRWKGLTLGLSVKNLWAATVKEEGEALIKDWRELYINVSYTFGFWNQNLQLSPYLLYFRERDNELDAGLQVSLFKKIAVAYAFRVLELRSIYSTRINIGKGVQIGAAVDHSRIFSDINVDFRLGYSF